MKDKQHIVRILIKGGILTPALFLKLTEAAKLAGNSDVSFGSRQDVLFNVSIESKTLVEDFLNNHKIDFEWKSKTAIKTQNIVSSFVANDVFPSTSWVNSGAYIIILEQFNYRPKIKINIVDPVQKLVPHFSGHLNFIASGHEHYWHLYIRSTKSKDPESYRGMFEWPELIYSKEIPVISEFLEGIITNNKAYHRHELVQLVADNLRLNTISNFEPLKRIPDFPPYYEGIHKMAASNDLWAGFYWRNNRYSINFIEHICALSLQTGIARISITPWKSFLVKNIQLKDRLLWEQLIGHFGINMQHSSFEMYWHLPFADEEALNLKRYIVKEFDKVDVRTFGLTFSIGKPEDPFTSVLIEKNWFPKIFNWLNLFKTYRISYAKDFNPETNEYLSYYNDVSHRELPGVLIQLSKKYYASLPELKEVQTKPIATKTTKVKVHECRNCLSVYVPMIGEPTRDIAPGTEFSALPADYCCELCESPMDSFVEKEIEKKYIAASL